MITDPGVAATGHPQRVAEQMAGFGIEAQVFDGARVEPTDASIQQAVEHARDTGPWDAFVAVGGGSAIDTAKAVNLLTTNPGELLDYVNVPVGQGLAPVHQLAPLVAVPTTTGTGSESTTVCVLDVLAQRVKTGISHPRLRPTLAVVDPRLTMTQPAGVTAACGMDILCHALESWTARPTRPSSARARSSGCPTAGPTRSADMWSERSMRLLAETFRTAVHHGDDEEAREGMALAATFAGMGFGNAGVHIPHANAYPVAGRVRDFHPVGYPDDHAMVPHGMAVALTAPAAFRFTFDADPGRHVRAAEMLAPGAERPDRPAGVPAGRAGRPDARHRHPRRAVRGGLRRGRRRRPRRGDAPAAAAARHRPQGGHRGRPLWRSCGTRWRSGDPRRGAGRPRRPAAKRRAARRGRLRPRAGALLLRRLALPGAAAGRGPAARRGRAGGGRRGRADQRHPADDARRRHLDRRQRRGPGGRGRHLQAPATASTASTRRPAPPGSSRGWCMPRCSGPRRRYALRFGPDPSTHTRCTLGGMIGNNACGSRALGYGRTSDNVVDLDVLTGTGERLHVGAGLPGAVPALDALVADHLGTIRTEFGRFGRQVSGYSLEHLLPERGRRLDRLLVGSEGTLAVVLGATVRLVEDAPFRALAVLGYPSMAEAADAVPALLAHPLVACEGLGHRIVDVVRARRGTVPDLPRGAGWLFAEVTADTRAEAEALAAAVVADAGALDARVVQDPAEQATLWRIREDGAGLAAVSLDRPAHAGWEDAAVPPARLGAYLRDFEALLVDAGLDGVPYGHFGDGCVHVRIDFELERAGRPGQVPRLPRGRRATGRVVRRHPLRRARRRPGPLRAAAADVLRRGDRPVRPGQGGARPRRPAEPRRARRAASGRCGPAAGHLAGRARAAARLRLGPRRRLGRDAVPPVHGGRQVPGRTPAGGVMCPSFQATRDEKDSTRGRARVLQEMLQGDLVAEGWASAGGARGARPLPGLQRLRERLPDRRGHGHLQGGGAAPALPGTTPAAQPLRPRCAPAVAAARPACRTCRRPAARPPVGAAGRQGRSRRRRASPGAGPGHRVEPDLGRPHLAPAAAADLGGPGDPDVVLWSDTFTDHFTPASARAVVTLLEQAGLRVGVVGERACCGLTWISTGQLDTARARSARTVRGAAARMPSAAIPVVGLEPSCLAMLRSDAGELLDDPAVAVVAAGARTLAELLETLPDWSPPDLTGVEVVVQPHCHHASVLGWAGRRPAAGPHRRLGDPGRRLLRPGRKLRRRPRPPRGLGGRRGARSAARRTRAAGAGGAAGRRLLLPHPARGPRRAGRRAPRRAPGRRPGAGPSVVQRGSSLPHRRRSRFDPAPASR